MPTRLNVLASSLIVARFFLEEAGLISPITSWAERNRDWTVNDQGLWRIWCRRTEGAVYTDIPSYSVQPANIKKRWEEALELLAQDKDIANGVEPDDEGYEELDLSSITSPSDDDDDAE